MLSWLKSITSRLPWVTTAKKEKVGKQKRKNPNRSPKRRKVVVRIVKYHSQRKESVIGIVIHYVSAINTTPNEPYNIDEIIKIFNTYKVSADYMIDRNGVIYKLIPDDRYSYHAGVSKFPTGEHGTTSSGKPTINEMAIGIEMIATNTSGYTEEQYNALSWLSKKLIRKYPAIIPTRVVGHEDISIPAGRKHDPGKLFDWEKYFKLCGWSRNSENSPV